MIDKINSCSRNHCDREHPVLYLLLDVHIRPAGHNDGLFHIAAVVPTMGTQFAFRQSYSFHKVIETLEFQ